MAEVTKGNEWVGIDPLTLWGKEGRIAVSLRNGYPRFTWFHRTEKGEPAKFFTAPMNTSMFLCLASMIKTVSASKTDIKMSLECGNRDYNTKEKIIQAVIIIAKRGNKIIFGMKNGGHDSKTSYAEFSLGEYGKVFVDDSQEDVGSISAALAYASYMEYIISVNHNTLAVNNSVPNTVRNEIDKKKTEEVKTEKIVDDIAPKEENNVGNDINDDIGF